jgi:hypothetical protein
MIGLIVLIMLSTLMSPLRVYSVPPPWDITVKPDTIYIGPPQCSASFTIYVTDFYKTYPVTIFIEPDPRNPYAVSGYLFDGTTQWPSKVPDWQSTVTAIFPSPWETRPGRYTLKIYAYPVGQQSWDVYATVDYVIEDTGIKTCSEDRVTTQTTPPPPPPPKCTEGKVEILQDCSDGATWKVRRVCHDGQWVMETQNCPTQPPGDWWHWWHWWRWDWWVGWWPWTTGEFDFSLDATPTSQSVKAGQSASFTADVKLVSGIAQPVTLSLSGLPSGATYSLSLPSADPTFTSALQISSQASLSPGTYTLTIVGTGGGKTHSTSVNLVVAENKQPSSLSLSVSPPSLQVGESVALGGALSPGLTTTVELVYVRPDGFELAKHVATLGAGAFSDAYRPDMPGPWSVKARWPGDADHYACESQTQSFSVEPPPEQPPSLWDQILRILPTVAIVAIIVIILVLGVALLRRRSARRVQAATPVSARFCGKCGTTIPEGSGYCQNCGEKFR